MLVFYQIFGSVQSTGKFCLLMTTALDPGKGVCADPVDGDAILGRGEPDPHSRNRELQLAPDIGRGKM